MSQRTLFFDAPDPALSALLWPLQFPYRAAVAIRNLAYSSGILSPLRPSCKVISIGNLTVGGTGKTPLSNLTAKILTDSGRPCAIVSRGYGRTPSGSEFTDDEALGSGTMTPRVANPDKRAALAEAERRFNPQCVILDDGFQSLYIERDLDVLVINGLNPFGNLRVLPAGPLREPLSAMGRADLVVVSHADEASRENLDIIERLVRKHTKAHILQGAHAIDGCVDRKGNEFPLTELSSRKSLAFCGIGSPASFGGALVKAKVKPENTMVFPDHHAYSKADCDDIAAMAKKSGADLLVTTLKDMTKLSAMELPSGTELVAIRISFEFIDGGGRFREAVLAL